MDDDEEEERHSAQHRAVETPSVKDEEPRTAHFSANADDNEYDLAFDDSESSQLPENPSAPAESQPEATPLTNFSTSIDDLIPQLESQQENFLTAPPETIEPTHDTSAFSLGDVDIETSDGIDISDPTTAELAEPEEESVSPNDRTEEIEEEATKRRTKPSFISSNATKKTPEVETSGITLKNDSTVEKDDDEAPTIAYLNTQARLSRQAENRKEAIRSSILYGIICLAVFIVGNWILFSFVLNNAEETGPIIPPLTDADIKKVEIEAPKDPKTPLNPDLALIKENVSKELILQSKSPTFSLKATCGASEQGLIHCKISGEGVESEMPSKKDRANGIKQPPWLTRLESDEITFNLVKKDQSRIAEGTANAYIMYDKLSNRVTVNVTLRTSPPPPEDALKKEARKLTVEVYAQKEIPADEGLEVTLTDSKQFALAAKASFDF